MFMYLHYPITAIDETLTYGVYTAFQSHAVHALKFCQPGCFC